MGDAADENLPTQMKIRVSNSKEAQKPPLPPVPANPLSPHSINAQYQHEEAGPPPPQVLTSPPIPPRPKSTALKGASALRPLSSPPVPPRPSRPTRASRVIGCGGSINNLSWSKSDTSLTFPCNNCIVTMQALGEGDEGDGNFVQETIATSSLIDLTAISPSSAVLATASSRFLKVYDASTNKCLASITLVNETEGMPSLLPPVSLTFSIDEQLLAVCHYDAQRRQCIVVYSLTTLLEQVRVCEG